MGTERGDRRAHDGEALLGELDRKVAEPVEDSEDFGVDVRGEVERALEEQVVQPVELILRQVLVVEIHAVSRKCTVSRSSCRLAV